MIVYEKNNKLNIDFENKIDGTPDIEIGKDEISVSGNNIVNGGSGSSSDVCVLQTTMTEEGNELVITIDKKPSQIKSEIDAGKIIFVNINGMPYSVFEYELDATNHPFISIYVCKYNPGNNNVEFGNVTFSGSGTNGTLLYRESV